MKPEGIVDLLALQELYIELFPRYGALKRISSQVDVYSIELRDLKRGMENNIPDYVRTNMELFGDKRCIITYLLDYLANMERLIGKYEGWRNLPNF